MPADCVINILSGPLKFGQRELSFTINMRKGAPLLSQRSKALERCQESHINALPSAPSEDVISQSAPAADLGLENQREGFFLPRKDFDRYPTLQELVGIASTWHLPHLESSEDVSFSEIKSPKR